MEEKTEETKPDDVKDGIKRDVEENIKKGQLRKDALEKLMESINNNKTNI